MITQGVCNSFRLEILNGVHQPTDDYRIALYTAAATLDPTTTVYTATNEVVAAGYTAGGQSLTGRVASLNAGVGIVDFDDAVWATVSITARGALIYNATQGNKAVAVYDFGSDITSTNGEFRVIMPTPDAVNAVLRID